MHKFNKEYGDNYYEAIAVTEHGFFNTYLKNKIACETEIDLGDNIKRTIKPIYGVESYHSLQDTTTDNRYKKTTKNKETGEETVLKEAITYHLPLLAKNDEGFYNIIKISSHAGMNSYKVANKPIYRTDIPFLSEHGDGVIALSGCMSGLIPTLILKGEYDKAKETALYFNEIFEHFYLELQCLIIPKVIIINEALIKMSKETGIELVITCDSHYVNEDDRPAHDILYSISEKDEAVKDEDGKRKTMRLEDSAHLRTPLEVEKYCIDYNIPLSAMDNTVIIANMCNVDFTPKDKKGFMPSYNVPQGYNENTFLKKMVQEKFYKRLIQKGITDNVSERFDKLNYELDVICNSGFAGYFLIVQDFVNKCKDNGIIVGPGRGSAAGSTLSYYLNITNIDPIPYDFLFERFLNPARVSMPDIDLDIESSKRREAIQILLDTYGEDNVCQIITYGKYSIKNTIKGIVSFYYNENENYKEINEEVNNFTKNTIGTNKINDKEITYDILYEISNNTESYLENNPDIEDSDVRLAKKIYEELKVLIDKYPEIEVGLSKLKGAINNIGTHAGGVIISSKSLKNNFPLARTDGSAILPIIQLEMTDIDFFSLLKLDALGLNTLSQLGSALEEANIPIDFISEEDFDDPKVYEFLRKGNTVNVFQMAKPQATRMLRDFKVQSLHDIMAVTAGVRPGLSNPTDVYGGKSPIDIYLEILNGKRERDHISPEIDKILDKTKGIIWYQEDCQLIGQLMAGYSLGESDIKIRKTIGKKLLNKIPEIRNEFIYGKASIFDENHNVIGISDEPSKSCVGAINNGFSEELAKKIFELIEAMAKYCFNSSHKRCVALYSNI